MQDIGRLITIFGIVIVLLGLILSFSDRIPFLGKLPGDILIRRGNFTLYAPIATSIIISVVLSIVITLLH